MLFGGETAESYYEEGLTSAMRGEYELAVQRFVRALELNSTLYPAHHQLGKCHLRLGRIESAIAEFEKAVQFIPEVLVSRIEWGFALFYTGQVSHAREKFSSVLSLRPEEPRAVLGLAYCAFSDKQWNTAVSLAQRAIDMGGGHFDAHFLIARAADKGEQLDLALSHYRISLDLMNQFLESNPDHASGYYLRGLVYYAQGFHKEALEDIVRALSCAQPGKIYLAYHEYITWTKILGMKGKCLYRLGEVESARRIGREILETDPDHALGHALANGSAVLEE